MWGLHIYDSQLNGPMYSMDTPFRLNLSHTYLFVCLYIGAKFKTFSIKLNPKNF